MNKKLFLNFFLVLIGGITGGVNNVNSCQYIYLTKNEIKGFTLKLIGVIMVRPFMEIIIK